MSPVKKSPNQFRENVFDYLEVESEKIVVKFETLRHQMHTSRPTFILTWIPFILAISPSLEPHNPYCIINFAL